ncbi:MAG: flagellar basal body L-ring protein FlgH [Formivibrio sp.]|nr:flagellar basal body L-ring protein FlgH [Formivibrio sp.]
MPTTARPYPVMAMAGNNGAIFQAHNAVMLFEEPLARRVGDVLTVEIDESLESTGKDNSTVSRTGSVTNKGSADDNAPALIRSLLAANNFTGSGDNQFKGKGDFETKNGVKATLAATVVDVLPNGNLLIGGDKRISVNGQQSTLRLTGVVNRKDLKAGNVVASKKIADARLELLGQGTIADANSMNWMQRVFLSVLSPF